MEITKQYCIETLHNQFVSGGSSQKENISQLMTASR